MAKMEKIEVHEEKAFKELFSPLSLREHFSIVFIGFAEKFYAF